VQHGERLALAIGNPAGKAGTPRGSLNPGPEAENIFFAETEIKC
jgi:hypothetical protein